MSAVARRHWAKFATKREMPFAHNLPSREMSPTIILHTNGGGTDNGSLYGWFSRSGNDICSHFQVAKSGKVEQYVGVDRQAYAQYSGNRYAVSIETEDDGKPLTKWTKAQVASIVEIAHWLGVPAKVSPDGPGGGVGWHEQYHDWNLSGHSCPGRVRERQIRDEVIPALHHAHQSRPKPTPAPHHSPFYRRWLHALRRYLKEHGK